MNRHDLNCSLPEDWDLPSDFPPAYMKLYVSTICLWKPFFLCNWCGARFQDLELAFKQKRRQMREIRLRRERDILIQKKYRRWEYG